MQPRDHTGLLAYVFWHWRREGVAGTVYEQSQRRFHAALAAEPPNGFVASSSFAISAAPWAAGGGDAYEDWYLVHGSAALDPLNEAAVTASRRAPHDAAAAGAGGGTAGLYALRFGAPVGALARAHWFAKPPGMTYEVLWTLLRPAAEQGALWMRRMVLGPAPEFCLHLPRSTGAPAGLQVLAVPLRRVWPDGVE